MLGHIPPPGLFWSQTNQADISHHAKRSRSSRRDLVTSIWQNVPRNDGVRSRRFWFFFVNNVRRFNKNTPWPDKLEYWVLNLHDCLWKVYTFFHMIKMYFIELSNVQCKQRSVDIWLLCLDSQYQFYSHYFKLLPAVFFIPIAYCNYEW